MIAETSIAAISGVEAALLVTGSLAIGAILGVAVIRARRTPPTPAEPPIHRPPSPASIGLDDDPIVAALVGPGSRVSPRGHGVALPGEGDPLT